MKKNKQRLPIGRRPANRSKGHRHLIITNGKVTELEYFRFLIEECDARGRVIVKYIEGDPSKVAKKMKGLLEGESDSVVKVQGMEPISSIWLVTDSDEFHNLQKVEIEIRDFGASLCISNPCFEVWLIDHSEACSDALYSSKCCERRAKELGVIKPIDSRRNGLSRCKDVNAALLKGKTEIATRNAQSHNTKEKAKIRSNRPDDTSRYAVWTDVPELVETVFGVSV